MIDLLQLVHALGLPGAIFVLAYVVAHYGIIEFVKVLGTALKRKVQRRAGEPTAPGSEQEPFVQGLAVMLLSLALGAVMGGLMLGGIATLVGVDLPAPWAGAVTGVLLAVVVSGLVAARRGKPDRAALLEEALRAVTAARQSAPALPAPPSWPQGPAAAPTPAAEAPPAPRPPLAPWDPATALPSPPAEQLAPTDADLRPVTPADLQVLGQGRALASLSRVEDVLQDTGRAPLVHVDDGPYRGR